MSPDRDLRIALVGCGHISAAHLAAWQRVPGARVVALCDRSHVALDARRAEFGIEAGYASFDRLLAEASVDAVDVCTTPEGRLPLVEAAAAAGKHLLVQKPLGVSVDEAEAMCRAAEARGVVLAIKENWRWYPWYRALGEALAAGRAGEVKRVAIRRTCWGSPDPAWRVWREQPYLQTRARAIWYEVGVHLVDTIRHLFGEPDDLGADMLTVSPLMHGEDCVHVVTRHGGALVTCDLCWAERGRPSRPSVDEVRIDGTRGRLEVHEDGSLRLLDDAGRGEVLLAAPAEPELESHVGAQAAFVEAVRLGREPAPSGRHHLRTLEVVLAAYDAAAGRRRIVFRPHEA